MLRFALLLLVLLFAHGLFAQSAARLTEQLNAATTDGQRLSIRLELARAYLTAQPRKAAEQAAAAYRLAVNERDTDGMARAAYLEGQSYEKLRDTRRAKQLYERSLSSAKTAGNRQLVLRNYEQLRDFARRNDRELGDLLNDVLDYTKNSSGGSSASTDNRRALADLRAETERLRKANASLQRELETARTRPTPARSPRRPVADPFSDPPPQTNNQALLDRALGEQQALLDSLQSEKTQVEARSRKRAKLIEMLNDQKSLDSMVLAQQHMEIQQASLELENAQLTADRSRYGLYFLGAAAAFVLVLALLSFMRLRARSRTARELAEKNKLIETERQRSDDLLLNILPKNIAKELKETGRATAQKFDEATVLFCDFVNFTGIAEQLTPEELVQELDTCFRGFDHIVSQYPDVEKIKTIGDAYLCVGGLTPRKTIPTNVIRAAKEMQQFLRETQESRQRLGLPFFEARIGIHTGPLVAGVVGVKKFAYDVWGDTVNVAARLESACEPGRINISQSTHGLVRYQFPCNYRGKVKAKNKGLVDMYYVE